MWSGVTAAITSGNFSEATNLKKQIEENQRNKAAERLEKGHKWHPRFFEATGTKGKPTLTEEGKKVIEGMLKGDYALPEGVGNEEMAKLLSDPAS